MCSLGLSFLINEGFRIGYSQLVVGLILCVTAFLLFATTIAGKRKKKWQKEL